MTDAYWPEGVPRHLNYPAIGIGEFMAAVCRHFDDQVALEDGDIKLTYRELLEQASQFAHALNNAGFGPGDTLAMHAPNSYLFVVSYLGTQLAGVTLSPLNPLSPAGSLIHQLNDAEVTVAVSHPNYVDALIGVTADTSLRRIILLPGTTASPATIEPASSPLVVNFLEFVADQPTEPPIGLAGPDYVAHLAFTGGTTGISKGVRVLNRNVLANVCQIITWRAGIVIDWQAPDLVYSPIDRDDAVLQIGDTTTVIVGPMYHAHALVSTLFLLTAGARVLISARFDPETLLELIESEGISYITGSPTMWHALTHTPGAATRDLSSVKTVMSGAAPIDSATLKGLEKTFPDATINEGWGLTEGTCAAVSTPGFHGAKRKLGSVGQPMSDVTVDIRDTLGQPVGPGELGEIWLRGPNVTDGYHRHPEKTRDQFVDGWLRTGDIGYRDDEGFLFISDRLKDMLIYKGYNVYPRELEEILAKHPQVDAVAVVGRDEPGIGQLPVAFVVAAPGESPDPELLMSFVAEQVLPYKKVREIHLVRALPSNAAGKILKTELRANLQTQHA